MTTPVEQQSPDWFQGGLHPETWISNPTECSWDVDDHIMLSGYGTLTTASASLCLIADSSEKQTAITVIASSPSLDVRMGDSAGHDWTATPVPSGNDYLYRVCILRPTFFEYPVIPGSNGGVGVRVDYWTSVSSSRALREVNATFQTSASGFWNNQGCIG